MRYLDSGAREAAQALGTWLAEELDDSVTAIRVQSGFFSADALPLISKTLKRLAGVGGLAEFVVGSNDGSTIASHLAQLITDLALPRAAARLAVVYYQGGYYHPKTLHFARADGSQAAYVGSANFTQPGLSARHVEAGLLLDSRDGDSAEILDQIAAASAQWFMPGRSGVEVVDKQEDLARLLEEGIIREKPVPRSAATAGKAGKPPLRPSLKPLFVIAAQEPEGPEKGQAALAPGLVLLPSIQRTPPYPPYMNFRADGGGPTRGVEALSGTGLGSATGLIIRLSRDNDRHWREAPGTANISIPVSTASTLRFGLYGPRSRPRAEFDFLLRYVDDEDVIGPISGDTSVMSYGFTPGDTGHQDLRMVLTKPPIAEMRQRLLAAGRALPKAGDLALLEWPTTEAPAFRLTALGPGSALATKVFAIWQDAASEGQTVSRGACWLPDGVAPAW